MIGTIGRAARTALATLALAALVGVFGAHAAVDGVTSASSTFPLTAREGFISAPDGGSVYMWGFALGDNTMQYPGPTLIVNQNDTVTVTLTNTLTVPASLVFPGQSNVRATGGTRGPIAREAAPGQTVTYTFTASEPGTYTYFSGTNPELQVEMGMFGAIVVRPASNPAAWAYNHADSAYDHEYLYLISDVDPVIHRQVMIGQMASVDLTTRFPVYWFINGRALPDTMGPANDPLLPSQPYNCLPVMHPGERVLIRLVGGGTDYHPIHLHGNHHRVIARDGRLQTAVAGADLAEFAFTTSTGPGRTFDAIFTWTGENMGWDIYGHAITDPLLTHADARRNEVFVPTTLSAGIGPGDLALTVTDGAGLPATASFRAVLWTGGDFPGTLREVVRMKRSSGNTFTIAGRGMEGTAASAWPGGAGVAFTDHGKAVPVTLPGQLDLTNGLFWSGSPFLGTEGVLPPGEGGFNPNSGFFFMWHSHAEKELTNFDIFPGGMATMAIVENPNVVIVDTPNIIALP
jgi:manganese oxidase